MNMFFHFVKTPLNTNVCTKQNSQDGISKVELKNISFLAPYHCYNVINKYLGCKILKPPFKNHIFPGPSDSSCVKQLIYNILHMNTSV